MIDLVIETNDRTARGLRNYFGDTLSHLHRAGVFSSVHLHSTTIVVDGNEDNYPWPTEAARYLPVGTRVDAAPRGRRANALRAMRCGLEGGAPWVVKLEDDIDVIDGFLESTAAWLRDHAALNADIYCLGSSWGETVTPVNTALYAEPGESVLEPGTSFPYMRRAIAEGRSYIMNPGYWGGQALAWPRATLEVLAAWFEAHLDDPCVGGQDVLLQKWGQSPPRRAKFCVTVPSFVQHIGDQSYMGTTFFQFPWPGRNWSYQATNIEERR